ncbi:MAG: hypothetical protein NTY39_08550 [Campylobacterales bacterium]|nr:hypothetical protein [Campylobacterales bacterium]
MRIKKTLLALIALQGVIFLLLLLSKSVFASFETAFISGALITSGSLYAYRNMIRTRASVADIEDNKDIIDRMDDPYDLYDEERENEITDIKAMIKEEKGRQKQHIIENTVKNSSAWVSVYRLIPYAFLILGFIGLQNNHVMQLLPYMVGLGAGIVTGYFVAREVLIVKSQ